MFAQYVRSYSMDRFMQSQSPSALVENIFVRSLSLSYNLQCEAPALVTLSSTTHVLLTPHSIGESPFPEIPISTLLVFSPDSFLASIEALC